MGGGRKVNMSETEKVKVGELEFSPEELTELVGAGQRLREIESKQGQPVDDILKSWGRRGDEIGKYKQELEEKERKIAELSRPATPEQLDEEQTREQVISEAKKFGLLTQEEARQMVVDIYNQNRAGEKLLSQTKKVLRQAEKDGRPTASVEELLEFMSDPNNPKDPQNAYDIKFKAELREWEKKQLETLKNKGMDTLISPATKTPERKSISTKDALTSALTEHFANFGN